MLKGVTFKLICLIEPLHYVWSKVCGRSTLLELGEGVKQDLPNFGTTLNIRWWSTAHVAQCLWEAARQQKGSDTISLQHPLLVDLWDFEEGDLCVSFLLFQKNRIWGLKLWGLFFSSFFCCLNESAPVCLLSRSSGQSWIVTNCSS